MTQASNYQNNRKYLLALGAVALLAVGVFGLSTLFVKADTGPAITTSTTNASNAVVTTAPIGGTVTFGATVASTTASTTPTGTVNFSKYNNLTCSGTPTTQSGVALVNGMASSSIATQSASGLSFLVNYNGDASNTPSVSSCATVSPTSGAVTITPTLSANTVNAGSSVTASSVLAGNTGAATGTVAYTFYTNNTCTLATSSPASVTVANGIVPTSAAQTFNVPGTYYLQAVYSGDNANASASSTCGSQILTVSSVNSTKNTTNLTTTLSSSTIAAGNTVTASSTLGGSTGAATGTVAYNVYSNSACTLNGSSAGTVNVTNGIVPNSNAVLFNTAGTYYFQGVYSGDNNNLTSSSSCVPVTIVATSTGGTGTTTGAAGTISGTVYNDVNRNLSLNSGEAGIAGVTVKLSVLKNTWWLLSLIGLNKYDQVTTTVTDANGNYSFGSLAAGVYKVEEIKAAGWHQDTPDFRPVPLGTNAGVSGLNFANHADGSNGGGNGGNTGSTTGAAMISGKVFNSANNVGIAGFTIKLTKNGNGNQSWTAVTDANGMYSFANLAAGKYKVEEINMAPWHQDTSDKNVTVGATGTQTVNFGNSSTTVSTGNGKGHGDGDNDDDDKAPTSANKNNNRGAAVSAAVHGVIKAFDR